MGDQPRAVMSNLLRKTMPNLAYLLALLLMLLMLLQPPVLENAIRNGPSPAAAVPCSVSLWQQGRTILDAPLETLYHGDQTQVNCKHGVPGPFCPWNKPIAFVHIGKAGGGTVNTVLRKVGLSYRQGNDSRDQIDQLHKAAADCRAGSPFLRHEVFIVTLRDPVDRFVSAYNWNGLKTRQQSIAKKCGSIDSMFSNNNETNSERLCGRIKSLVLAQSTPGECDNVAIGYNDIPEVNHGCMVHLIKGFCFHLGGCVAALRERRESVMVVRVERMAEDLAAVTERLRTRSPDWFDDSGANAKELAWYLKDMRKANPSSGQKTLSPEARRKLEIALAEEYRLVNHILTLAGADTLYCTAEANLSGVCHK